MTYHASILRTFIESFMVVLFTKDNLPNWLSSFGKIVLDKLRMSGWGVIAVVLVLAVAVIAPVQVPVILYKAAIVASGAFMGYWIDRHVAPYARPDAAGLSATERAAATNRRGIIVGATILAVALAL